MKRRKFEWVLADGKHGGGLQFGIALSSSFQDGIEVLALPR